jgi:hypothetical protein
MRRGMPRRTTQVCNPAAHPRDDEGVNGIRTRERGSLVAGARYETDSVADSRYGTCGRPGLSTWHSMEPTANIVINTTGAPPHTVQAGATATRTRKATGRARRRRGGLSAYRAAKAPSSMPRMYLSRSPTAPRSPPRPSAAPTAHRSCALMTRAISSLRAWPRTSTSAS